MTATNDFADGLTKARAHIEAALIARATEDERFRALLKADPHAALKELMGTDPIPSLTIRVVEEQPGEVTLVLPRQIAEDELPDELLDLASGGVSFSSFVDYSTLLRASPNTRACPR
ncbi:NHLP leader peptide family natural product precursor [Microvirga tunisiensis]|uniref:NHLP leader peptide family natural product n=2 Tax=Pannonibacter tanglangensis TaxID=2750084 RepID=A0ABW9ZJM5_9HYPH|nr:MULTISPECIES: NHLP leader peptide family natural product precursor [unclassified Pannonibacter]NBN65089.1 NHLP leader peptide family natural product precursor [Pannonibacter sp. XCT-34]NBN79935.1 NHLP leader peptide family natural product precursor [Pannonibacter sp. XCT-53]